MTPLDRQTARRLTALFAGFGGLALVLAGRLFYWQLLPHPELLAADDAMRLPTPTLKAGRGAIYDRTGRLLAADVANNILVAYPKDIKDPADLASRLARMLGRPEAELRPALEGKQGKSYVRVARNLPDTTVKALEKAIDKRELVGVNIEREAQRTYPMGTLAAHILGFVGGDRRGHYGVEQNYDDALRGEEGTWGAPVLIDPSRYQSPRDGFDLVLTIDANIQRIVERELSKAIEAQDAEGGTAIVMDPRTGAILAMASVPTYDPNLYGAAPNDRYVNPAISRLYEPGSVLKAMTLSAALEEGVATLDTTYNDVGYIKVNGFTIWDWDRVAHGKVDMRTMMRLSLNVGTVYLSQWLGAEKFYFHIRNFGFGSRTGIDLAGEEVGIINDQRTKNWNELSLATNSFGQGLASTPIQVVSAMAAIANGGNLMQPYVLHQLRQGDKVVKETRPIVLRRVVSPQTVPAVREALVGVVEHAVRAGVPGYTIGGKTGSSQIPVEGGYDPDMTIASFVGFGPVHDPRFVILVKVDKPVHRQLGSEVAAPFFGALARQLFDYLDIPPDNVRQAADNRKPRPEGSNP